MYLLSVERMDWTVNLFIFFTGMKPFEIATYSIEVKLGSSKSIIRNILR